MAFFLAARIMSLYVIGVIGVFGVFAGSSLASTPVDGRVVDNSCAWDSVRSIGLLLFLTSENVLDTPLSSCVGVLGTLAGPSSSGDGRSCCLGISREYVEPFAYGSMLRKGGLFFTSRSDSRVPFREGCTGDGMELTGVSGRSTGDRDDEAVLDRVRVAIELGDMDRLRNSVRSTIDGLPEYTTDTTRAVSSWLLLRVGDNGSSLLES